MTGKALFKIPTGRRALRLAREQGFEVTGYTVHPDGTIDITVRDGETRDDGTLTPPNDLSGEAAA